MVRELEGDLKPSPGTYAIVVSRFNASITQRLLDGAVETLKNHGVKPDAIEVIHVPGAWEIPIAVRWLLDGGAAELAAVLCLGAVIRGETTHDQHINRQVSDSLGKLAVHSRIPVAFGLLTCNTYDQAVQRVGGEFGHKGEDCAKAALRMAALRARLRPAELAEDGVDGTPV